MVQCVFWSYHGEPRVRYGCRTSHAVGSDEVQGLQEEYEEGGAKSGFISCLRCETVLSRTRGLLSRPICRPSMLFWTGRRISSWRLLAAEMWKVGQPIDLTLNESV